MDAAQTRIMIVDDHFVLRMGLKGVLAAESGFVVVAEASNGTEAVARYRAHRPDVTLMDLRLPEMSGVETMAAIRSEFPDARFIVLTTSEGDEDIYRAFQAGARGYLLKSVAGPELIEAIRAVHAGMRRVPPLIASRLAERVEGNDLTTREIEVLRLMVRGLSNRAIGSALEISEGTAKNHVKRILSKLGVSARTQAVRTALERGIVHLASVLDDAD